MSTKLLNTCAHSLVFKPCSSAIAFRKAPLLMALAFVTVFIDFIGAILEKMRGKAVHVKL